MAIEAAYEYTLTIKLNCIATVGDVTEVPDRAAKVVDDVIKLMMKKYPYSGVVGFKVEI